MIDRRGTALMLCLALASTAALVIGAARAHPPAILNQNAEKAVGEEVSAFRKAISDAVAAKDKARLKDMYHPGFTHTRHDGPTVKLDAHLAAALAGEPMIESAKAEDIVIRIPNDWVAVVTGTSTLSPKSASKGGSKDTATAKPAAKVKWIQVFTRSGSSWVLVASQATHSQEIKP